MAASGFSLYSLPHITILVIVILACIFGAFLYRKVSEKIRNAIGLGTGIILVLMDLVHYAVYDLMGILGVQSIPLHLCAIALYMCLLHSIFRADWMGQVLYDLCLPGVWCALLFPDWTGFPLLSYPSLHSFITHGLVSLYIIMQLASRRICPRLAAIWKPVLFLCVTVTAAAIANRLLGTNFMFISLPAPGSPLEWLAVLAESSHAFYLILFAVLALIVMTAMYLPFIRRGKCQKS